MDLSAIAQIATAITTVVLALVAYQQAKASQRQAQATEETVNEMRESRRAQERPHVIVETDHSRPPYVFVVLRNIGKGAAKDITFEFSAPMESPQSADPGSLVKPVNEQPYFQRGMPFLAPGAEIRCLWGSMIDLAQFLRDRNLEDGITITSRYESLTGDSYETPWTVNPLLIADRVSLERDIQRDE